MHERKQPQYSFYRYCKNPCITHAQWHSWAHFIFIPQIMGRNSLQSKRISTLCHVQPPNLGHANWQAHHNYLSHPRTSSFHCISQQAEHRFTQMQHTAPEYTTHNQAAITTRATATNSSPLSHNALQIAKSPSMSVLSPILLQIGSPCKIFVRRFLVKSCN